MPSRNLWMLFVMLLVISGCTRAKEESASVSISLPSAMKSSSKLGAQTSASDLSHVIINVSGPGISEPILYVWDKCHECNGNVVIPESFRIDQVPSGSDRLVQVLAVYQASGGGSMEFYYGDLSKTLSSGVADMPVVISQLPVSDGSTMVETHISGRYLKPDGSGPTGQIHMIFSPGGNRQPMLVEKSPIVAGWFSVFALDNVMFDFRVQESGGSSYSLFGGPVNANSAIFNPSSRVVKAGIPVHDRQDGGSNAWTPDDAAYYIWGWFGDAAQVASKTVYNSETGTPANFTRFRQLSTANLLQANNAAIASKAALLDTASPLSIANFNGGVGSPGTTAMLDYMSVNRLIIENGNDNAAGFRVPFQLSGGGSIFNVATSGNIKTISGNVLPGVPGAIDAFRAFKKVGVSTNFYADKVSCNELLNGTSGYTMQMSLGVVNPNLSFSMPLDITPAEATQGTAVVLCAVKNGVMADSGIFLGAYTFNGGGYSMPVPAKFGMTLANGLTAAIPGSCVPLDIDLQDSSGNPAAATNVIVNISTSFGNLYDSSYCDAGSLIGASTTLNYTMRKTIYYKGVASASTVTATSSGLVGIVSGTSTESLNIGNSAGSTTPTVLALVDPMNRFTTVTTLNRYECKEFYLQLRNSSGEPVNLPASSNFSVPPAQLGNMQLFTDGNCATTASTVDFFANMGVQPSQVRFYARPINSPTITLSGGPYAGATLSGTVNITDHTNATQLGIKLAGELNSGGAMLLPAGICLPLIITSYENTGTMNVPATPPTNRSLSLTAAFSSGSGTLQFYSNPTCLTVDSSPQILSSGFEAIR